MTIFSTGAPSACGRFLFSLNISTPRGVPPANMGTRTIETNKMEHVYIITLLFIQSKYFYYIFLAICIYFIFAHKYILSSLRSSPWKYDYLLGGYLVDKNLSRLLRIIILLCNIGFIYVLLLLFLKW